jgi:hypothetical protein
VNSSKAGKLKVVASSGEGIFPRSRTSCAAGGTSAGAVVPVTDASDFFDFEALVDVFFVVVFFVGDLVF